jgi:branched-chain amino acid transport system substrate-binding protein
MNKTTKIIIGVVVLILVVCFAWYFQKNQQQAVNQVTNSEPIKIGWIGPLTGDSAVVGDDAAKTIQLVVDETNNNGGINGRKIQLFIEDDQYDTAKTLSAYNKLVKVNNVKTLLISTYGGVMALANQVKEDNVTIIDPLDCDSGIANGENIFCVAKQTNNLGYVIADHAYKRGFRNIGVLYATVDAFMPAVKDAFQKKFVELGGNVQAESYIKGTTDFKTTLLKFKGKDAIFFLGYDELGIAMKQTRDLGIKAQFLAIPNGATSPAIQKASQGAIEGTEFVYYEPLETNTEATQFYKKFEEKYSRKPIISMVSDPAYDAIKILTDKGLKNVDFSQTGAEQQKTIKNNLLGVNNYPGIEGNLSFDKSGKIGGINLDMFVIKNNTPVRLKD